MCSGDSGAGSGICFRKEAKKDFSEAVTHEKLSAIRGYGTRRVEVSIKGLTCAVLATGDFARANPLPYSKAIQIGTNVCQTNAKPWNKESPISNSI